MRTNVPFAAGEKTMKKIYEEMNTKQAMTRVTEPRMPFSWSINPYRGCTHGCSFCYARATHSYLGMGVDDSFQNYIFQKNNVAEALEDQLKRKLRKHSGNLEEMSREIGQVVIGTATDPYQPIEAKANLTRQCLKVLSHYQIPTMITTRSPLILRDMDLLKEMNITSINVSINTMNSELCRSIEPATPFPRKRLETVHQLVDEGITAGIFIAPILPKLTDSMEELEYLIREAKQHKAMFAVPSVLRLKPEVKSWYFKTLEQTFRNLLPAYGRQYKTGYASASYVNALMARVHQILDKYMMPYKIPENHIKSVPAMMNREEQISFSF
jgi:DNA repair photolyase